MENLPRDIHLEIFSRLPIISFSQIKLVCKAWHAFAKDPRLLSMFSARASKRNPSLILHCDHYHYSPTENKMCYISPEEKEGSNHDYYSNKVVKVAPPFISNMPKYQVVGSCNGLICISNALYFDPIYLCNIFTGDYRELPKSIISQGEEEQEVALGFGNHPATNEYKIVRVVYYRNSHGRFRLRGLYQRSDVQIFTLGSEAWRSLGSIDWRLDLRPSEATINGALHWITVRYVGMRDRSVRIVAFDLAQEKFEEIDCPMCGNLNPFNFHLVDLRGCLSAVVRYDERIEIWVMKVYDVKESWTKEYVITSNVPASLSGSGRQTSKVWRIKTLSKQHIGIEVVCMLQNGDLLLNYDEGGLVLYSPHDESFKELVFSGLPRWFSLITHVEALFSVEEVLRM